jgi:hypothetical protein
MSEDTHEELQATFLEQDQEDSHHGGRNFGDSSPATTEEDASSGSEGVERVGDEGEGENEGQGVDEGEGEVEGVVAEDEGEVEQLATPLGWTSWGGPPLTEEQERNACFPPEGMLRPYALRPYALTPSRPYAFTPLRPYALTPLRPYALTPLRPYALTPLPPDALTP